MLTMKKLALATLAAPLLLAGALGVPGAAQAQAPVPVAPSVRGLPDFTDLVDQVGPTVVNIRTVERVRAGGAGRNGQMDEEMQEFFRRFFGIPMPNVPRQQGPRPSPQEQPEREVPRGVGSGFIISPDGFVMTNAHVVDGADEVIVTLTDKREFKARLIGADKRTDVAVVKIEAAGLPAVRIGDINRLRVGEWVMAIGSPFGLDNTVTAGIVSAKQRDTGDYLPFIQTDVAVNPGNSGGPLFDARGRVVGINSQIYSRTGGYQGLSFAIPIDVAVRVKDQILATGSVRHARLGVTVQELNQGLAESFKLDSPNGALVSAVAPGSAAEKAGLRPGDVVLSLNGERIERSGDLAAMVGKSKPGDRVTLEVVRQGKREQLTAVLAELPTSTDTAAQQPPERSERRLGVAVRPLAPEERQATRLNAGLVVEDVSGPAQRAGIEPGDVILSVNGKPVASVEQLRALVNGDARQLALLVQRGELRIFVPVRLG